MPASRQRATIVGKRCSSRSCAEVPGVEQHVVVAALAHPAVDRLGDDVARGEVGQRVVVGRDDPLAGEVDEDRALAADRLRHQRLLPGRAGAEPQRRGVELHELQVGDLRAGPQRERHPVAGRDRRVGGAGVHLAEAAGREHDGPGQHGADAVLAALAEHVQRDAGGAAVRVGAAGRGRGRARRAGCAGTAADRGDERALHLRAGRVAAGVHDPVAGVAALAGQRERAGAVAVEGRAQLDELAQPARGPRCTAPGRRRRRTARRPRRGCPAGAPPGCRRPPARRRRRPAPSGWSRRRRAPW